MWKSDIGCFLMIDYTKLAFASTLKYMRIYNDYVLPPGGGTIVHNLGYVPYFIPRANQATVNNFFVAIRTGTVTFPGDSAFLIIAATSTTITVTEDLAPTNPTTYYVRVYEDPLP